MKKKTVIALEEDTDLLQWTFEVVLLLEAVKNFVSFVHYVIDKNLWLFLTIQYRLKVLLTSSKIWKKD